MAERARLESVCTSGYRGFESLSLRHTNNRLFLGGFFMAEREALMKTLRSTKYREYFEPQPRREADKYRDVFELTPCSPPYK